MTSAITLWTRLARLRTGATSLPQTVPQPSTPATPTVLNLVPDPGFRGPLDRPFEAGGVHVHAHNSCELAEVPGRPGVSGARVEGVGRTNDTFIAPGGYEAPGAMRLGMRAGATYTAGVSVFLPAPLTGALHPAALRLAPGCVTQGARRALKPSPPARNEYGHHRISVTFTVPATATSAWISLHSGMARGGGTVHWYDFALTETAAPVDHFDGSTPDDLFHTHEWTGEPNASPSRRTLRVDAAATPAEIAAEAVRLARAGAGDEVRHLQRHLGGDRLAAARIALAEGQEQAAVKVLRRVVKAGDPDGAAAYELGRLALAEGDGESAEKLLREAVAKRPEAYERGTRWRPRTTGCGASRTANGSRPRPWSTTSSCRSTVRPCSTSTPGTSAPGGTWASSSANTWSRFGCRPSSAWPRRSPAPSTSRSSSTGRRVSGPCRRWCGPAWPR